MSTPPPCPDHPTRFERPCRWCAAEHARAARGFRLTYRQESFAQHYVRLALEVYQPGAEAARRAGYKGRGAAYRVLRRSMVRDRIAELAAAAWGREANVWTVPPRKPAGPPCGKQESPSPTAARRAHLDDVRRLLDSLPDKPEDDASEQV